MADQTTSPTSLPWWDGAIGYEIYIRSFADTTGSGFGDLAGVKSKLEYFSWLGVDTIWMTPFYPSPDYDNGYDVADYCDIDPKYGTLADFDSLLAAAHDRGLRVIVDLVPNHTSSHHSWFQDSIGSLDADHRDFYIWRDPAPDGGPPNNWVSHFGGPAWTLDPDTNQYYCHLFLSEQPDLNWANPKVRSAIDDVFRFWCERGVDGFRLDVAHGMTKDYEFRSNPQNRPLVSGMGPTEVFESYDHVFDLDRDENSEIYERWNRVVRPYGALLLGEVNSSTPDRIARFGAGDRLHRSFFLRPGWTNWEPSELLEMLVDAHDASPNGLSLILNNHDQARSVSRFGGGDLGLARTKAVSTLLFAMGGMPFLYQGEELGLDNSLVEAADRTDPVWTQNESGEVGRDVTRGPIPWTTEPGNGFTTGTPWMATGPRPAEQSVAAQRDSVDSALHWYRSLIQMRHEQSDTWEAELEWIPTANDTSVALQRGVISVLANLGPDPVKVDIGRSCSKLFESRAGCASLEGNEVVVSAEATVVLLAG